MPGDDNEVEDLLRALGQLIRRVRQEAGDGALTWSQGAALSRLAREGSMTTAELARAEQVKPQSMGATLAALEGEALVERHPHPTDGRQVLFAATPRGAEMQARSRRRKREWLAAAMARLDPAERQTLVSSLAVLMRLGAG